MGSGCKIVTPRNLQRSQLRHQLVPGWCMSVSLFGCLLHILQCKIRTESTLTKHRQLEEKKSYLDVLTNH